MRSAAIGRRRRLLWLALAVVVALVAVVAALGVLATGSSEAVEAEVVAVEPDLRRDLGENAPFLQDFDPEALTVGAGIDVIPAIDDPIFEAPDEVTLLSPSDLVVGVELDGEARAYPTKLLSLHEVVNDEIGGRPVVVTWCPLCQTALAFDRRVAGETLRFGVSGWLYSANLLLFDRSSGSLWSQLLGGAVTGSYRGTELEPVPVVHETWEAWLTAHPDTKVLSVAADEFFEFFTDETVEASSRGDAISSAPYAEYTQKVKTYFGREINGIPGAERMLGVVAGPASRAYRLLTLQQQRVIEDTVGEKPIVVTWDPEAVSANAFTRQLDDERVLSFRRDGDELVDAETGSRWSLRLGKALSGPLEGTQLERAPATFSYWFAWSRIYPSASVYPHSNEP